MATYASQSTVEKILERPLTTDEAALFPMIAGAIDEYFNDILGVGFGNPEPATRYYDNLGSKFLEIDPVYYDPDHTKEAEGGGDPEPDPIDFEVFYVDANDTKIGENIDKSLFAARPRNEKVKTYFQLRNGIWRRGTANVAVHGKFTRGLTVPDDIAYAANYLAAQFIVGVSEDSLSLESETIEGYARKFANVTRQHPIILATLDKYKDIML